MAVLRRILLVGIVRGRRRGRGVVRVRVRVRVGRVGVRSSGREDVAIGGRWVHGRPWRRYRVRWWRRRLWRGSWMGCGVVVVVATVVTM